MKINAAGLKDREKADAILAEAAEIARRVQEEEAEVIAIANKTIDGEN